MYQIFFFHLSVMSIQVVSMSWLCKQCCYEHWGACIYLNQNFLHIYIPGSGIAGSHGNSTFSFKNKLHRIFHVATPAYIPINSVGGFLFLHTVWKIYFVDFLMMTILTNVTWYFIEIWIFISVINSHVEHLFMCLLVMYVFFAEVSIQVS